MPKGRPKLTENERKKAAAKRKKQMSAYHKTYYKDEVAKKPETLFKAFRGLVGVFNASKMTK